MASVRRQRLDQGVAEDPVLQEPHMDTDIPGTQDVPTQHVGTEDVGAELESYPGGPEDYSLLTSYVDHVAFRVWAGEEHAELKLASHRQKVIKFGKPAPEIQGFVAASGLAPLISCCVDTGDRGLLSAFVERWHPETSSFQLPVGEVTVTLDDVASILHIPVMGTLQSYDAIDIGEAITMLVDLLEVTVEEADAKTTQCHGAYVRLSWLRDLYHQKCEARQWTLAARAYLMHLVGCTVFANKSATHIGVVFLEAFRDMDDAARYAWGAAALVHMYDNLNYACKHHGKHLAGYITLLQCWIYEHFPKVGNVVPNDDYQEVQPRVCRWKAKALPLSTYRLRIDRLTSSDVCWTSYEDHRLHREFEMISLYSRAIKWGPYTVRYCPERVLRQFGYVQHIPEVHIHDMPYAADVDGKWMHFTYYIVATEDLVDHLGQHVAGYMEWFYRVSHPVMTSTQYEVARSRCRPEATTTPVLVAPPVHQPRDDVAAGLESTISSTGHTHGHAMVVCERMAEGLQHMFDFRMVTEGTDAYSMIEQLLRVARGVTGDGLGYTRTTRPRQT